MNSKAAIRDLIQLKLVYIFGGGSNSIDPRTRDKTIVGGKGANLAEMAGIGLPVPPGFTITTEECVRLSVVRTFAPKLPNTPERSYAQLREVAQTRLNMLSMRSTAVPLVQYAKKDLGLEVTEKEYLAAPGRADFIKRCEAEAAAVKL